MALPAAATLPTPPTMLGADDTAKQEYFAALQKTLDALEARANQGPNWFQLAGALLDPGRTGNVGEAIGRAATTLGAQQERQAEMQLPIAQVRAQLAGQKYETENQSKAVALLSQTLGTTPDKVQDVLATGQASPDTLSKLAQVYPVIAQLSPKVADIVKGAFGMQKDISSLDLENKKFLVQSAQADRTAGMSQADLVAKYGAGILQLIPGGGMPITQPQPQPAAGAMPPAAGAMPSPIPATTNPAVLPILGQVQDLRKLLSTTQDPTLASNARDQLQRLEADLKTRFGITMPAMPTTSTAPVVPTTPAAPATPTAPATPAMSAGPAAPAGPEAMRAMLPPTITPPTAPVAATITPSTPPDLQGMPLATQAEVAKKRVEESDKPYNAKRDEILSYTPQLLESSNTNLRQLDQIARQRPQIFALMQQQGLMSGLMTLAQEGAQLTAGTFNARLGLPVQQFLEKTKLSPDDQQAVRDVSRILGSEFLSNVKANKGLLGVNPTDNDARLLQAPMASIQDSARAVQLWSRQQLLLNKQREAMYGALSEYTDQAGTAASPRKFFSPGSVYDKINKDYARFRMQLFRQFYPTE